MKFCLIYALNCHGGCECQFAYCVSHFGVCNASEGMACLENRKALARTQKSPDSYGVLDSGMCNASEGMARKALAGTHKITRSLWCFGFWCVQCKQQHGLKNIGKDTQNHQILMVVRILVCAMQAMAWPEKHQQEHTKSPDPYGGSDSGVSNASHGMA